jgi:hypothetical protein
VLNVCCDAGPDVATERLRKAATGQELVHVRSQAMSWRGFHLLAIGKRLKLCETAGHHSRAYAPPWRPPAQCRAATAETPEKLARSPEKPGLGATFGLTARRLLGAAPSGYGCRGTTSRLSPAPEGPLRRPPPLKRPTYPALCPVHQRG